MRFLKVLTWLALSAGVDRACAQEGSGLPKEGGSDLFCSVKVSGLLQVVKPNGDVIREFPVGGVRTLRPSGESRLLATLSGGRVVELDLFGNVLWSLPELPPGQGGPGRGKEITCADALPGGRLLIAACSPRPEGGSACHVMEVDRQGNVFRELRLSTEKPGFRWIRGAGADRLRVCPLMEPPYEITWDAEERRQIAQSACLDLLELPDGHVVLSKPRTIWEVDEKGETVWSANHPEPGQLLLLRSGNILAAFC